MRKVAERLKTIFIDVKIWHHGVKNRKEVEDRDRDEGWEDVESWKTGGGRGRRRNDRQKERWRERVG